RAMSAEPLLSMPTLPAVPDSVADAQGQPRFGTYSGSLPRVDLESLRGDWAPGALRTLTRRKRWHYTIVGTPEVLCVMAMVDVGCSATGFLSAVDLKDRRVLFDDGWLFPPAALLTVGDAPAEGLHARMSRPGLSAAIERGVG